MTDLRIGERYRWIFHPDQESERTITVWAFGGIGRALVHWATSFSGEMMCRWISVNELEPLND